MATDEPIVEGTRIDPAATSDSAAGQSRLQLRLHHAFALTAVAAVLLALYGRPDAFHSDPRLQPPPLIVNLMTAWGVLYVLLAAVAVTAVAYGIAWQRMGLPFFDEPGHWLLVEIGVTSLFSMVPTIAYRWIFSAFNLGATGFPFVIMMLVSLYSLVFLIALPMGLNIYFGVKKCRESRWSTVFYLKAAGKVLFGLMELVIIPMVIVAMRRDRREGVVRDSAHRCGAWLQLALSVYTCFSLVVSAINMAYMFSQM